MCNGACDDARCRTRRVHEPCEYAPTWHRIRPPQTALTSAVAEPERVVEAPTAVPAALRGGPYQTVRRAWEAGCRAADPTHPPLRAALQALARTARDGGVAVSDVLRTLDAVCRPSVGGDGALDWDHVREWAGRVVIAAYYRDD